MDANTGISRFAIVGTGPIGSSWAACFLAHGLHVVATDPAGREEKLRQCVEMVWAALTKFGLAPDPSTSRLQFTGDLKEAVAGADLVQENAPGRELYRSSQRSVATTKNHEILVGQSLDLDADYTDCKSVL